MHPVLFEIFGRQIPTYGVALSSSLIICSLLTFRLAKKEGIEEEHFLACLLVALIGLIFTSRAFHIVINFSDYLADPKAILNFRTGHVFYGGYLGTIIFPWVYTRIARIKFIPIMDVCAAYMPLGLAIHRTFGCTMAGCCHGFPTDLPWGITYPAEAPASLIYGQIPVHPSQIYESLFALAMFAVLILWRKFFRKAVGELIALQIAMYAVGRFFIEYFRGDGARGFYWVMSTSQWVSVAMLAAAAILLFLVVLPGRKKLLEKTPETV